MSFESAREYEQMVEWHAPKSWTRADPERLKLQTHSAVR